MERLPCHLHGDFTQAVVASPATAAVPPISYVNNPPPGTTNLDCTTRNTLLVTVANANLTAENFLNGPVQYAPIQLIMDDTVIILPANLIQEADNGTFGTFPQGTTGNTGANPNPYPSMVTDFTFVQPNPVVITPSSDQYTIQNLMNNSHGNTAGSWWRVADHTTGNETGRLMVVNGDAPGTRIFQTSVAVLENTNYLFSSWILNMCTGTQYVNPALAVEILDSTGDILYERRPRYSYSCKC